MLTRELLSSDAFLESFRDLPGHEHWTRERIQASMRETLARRPDVNAPVWLFAYGSLIWNPIFHFAEQRRATLPGWHRSFCIRLVAGRGSDTCPGRMLGLEASGHTEGVALRLSENDLEPELMLVWVREMIGGVYQPLWAPVTLEDGSIVQAIIFVADTTHASYAPDASPTSTCSAIAHACGHMGANRDYLFELDKALAEQGIRDEYVVRLAEAVRAACARHGSAMSDRE